MTTQDLLIEKHGETIQIFQQLFHLMSLWDRDINSQRNATNITSITIERMNIALPGDSSQETQFIKLRFPQSILIPFEIDRKKLDGTEWLFILEIPREENNLILV